VVALVGGDELGQDVGQLGAQSFQGASLAQVAGFAGEPAGSPIKVGEGYVQLGARLSPGVLAISGRPGGRPADPPGGPAFAPLLGAGGGR
jgi:hypothetical protein